MAKALKSYSVLSSIDRETEGINSPANGEYRSSPLNINFKPSPLTGKATSLGSETVPRGPNAVPRYTSNRLKTLMRQGNGH